MVTDFLKDWDKGGHTEAHISEKKAKHTPGPWEAAPRRAYRDMKGESRVILGDDKRIAVVHCHQNDPEDNANARLIAAAPDLLLALIDAMYQHDHKHLTPDEHWYHIAKRAIAKVKGK